MKRSILLLLIAFICYVNAGAQTINPSPYCYAGFAFIGGDTTGSDWINSVQLGTLDNATNSISPGVHYTFYNNLTVPNLIKGSSDTLKLNFYIGGGAGFAAWIDFNHDNVFDSTELIAGITASTGIGLGATVPVTKIIAIPATAMTGNTRMRVRISEDDDYHGAHPGAYELACDSLNTTSYGGETEDYTVNIVSETAVKEVASTVQVAIYPNPATDVLTIACTTTEPLSLSYSIYSVTGTKISEGVLMKATTTVDVSGLPAGLYIIKVAGNGQQVEVQKFFKK